jgi:CIC family chloride channel protein
LLWVGTEGITGGGYTTLTIGLAGKIALKAALVLTLFKLVATVFSYASGGSGGIFAPSLFIGGMLGCSVGYLDQFLFGTSGQIGAFALVGMGAVFAGIIRAPITSVLIIFEMTDGYALIPPLMIANMTAYLLARHWHTLPIYESLLEQDGFPIRNLDETRLSRTPVASVMTTKMVLVEDSATVNTALDQLADYEYAIYPVIGPGSSFVGFINRYRLLRAFQKGEGDHMVSEYMVGSDALHPDTPLSVAVDQLHRDGVHLLPVVERSEPHALLGLLTSSDVVKAEAEAAAES